MRCLALLTAAATALGATLGNAAQDVESRLSKVIGGQHDLESIKSLPEHKQELLCLGTASSGSVDKAALKVVLGADGEADMDKVHAYLQGRCHANGPVTHMKFIKPHIYLDADTKKKLCDMARKADSAFDATLLGDIAETLGYDNPFSKHFERLISSKCGVRRFDARFDARFFDELS